MAGRTIRLLPSIMVVGSAALGLQLGGMAKDITALTQAAQAQEGTAAGLPTGGDSLEKVPSGVPTEQQPLPEELDPAFMDPSEIDLLRELAQRRAQLDEHERQVDLRERLLEATERRIDTKIGELKALEEKIAAMMVQHDSEETRKVESLVKVYEKMKPKDAAQVYQRLALDIQISVARQMKEAKMAPIMAEMDPESAKTLSTALARRTPLPQIPSGG